MVDKLNFNKVFYIVGILNGKALHKRYKPLKTIIEELSNELNIALGYEKRGDTK